MTVSLVTDRHIQNYTISLAHVPRVTINYSKMCRIANATSEGLPHLMISSFVVSDFINAVVIGDSGGIGQGYALEVLNTWSI